MSLHIMYFLNDSFPQKVWRTACMCLRVEACKARNQMEVKNLQYLDMVNQNVQMAKKCRELENDRSRLAAQLLEKEELQIEHLPGTMWLSVIGLILGIHLIYKCSGVCRAWIPKCFERQPNSGVVTVLRTKHSWTSC